MKYQGKSEQTEKQSLWVTDEKEKWKKKEFFTQKQQHII